LHNLQLLFMEENQSLFSLTIDPLTKSHLNDTAKWARVLAILTIVVLIIVFIFSILSATVLNNSMTMNLTVNGQIREEVSNSMRVGMVIGSIIMIGIAFIPVYFIMQFSSRIRRALAANDQDLLNDSFSNLKKYFRALAIILIVVIALYILVFFLTMISGSFQK